MYFKIITTTFHSSEIERIKLNNAARRQRDVSDVGLSSWATGCLIGRHRRAIEALEAGDSGFPSAPIFALWHGEKMVSTTRSTDRYGKVHWSLTAEQRANFNRYSIPCGERSRVQRSLGLREERRIVRVNPWFEIVGNGIGGRESYKFDPV